jgi:excisionase family DNA binding protein
MSTGADRSADLATGVEFLTVFEAAELTGYSVSTLRRWDRLGQLKALRTPSGQYRYEKSELLASLYRRV